MAKLALKEGQKKQLHNIIETLVEATEHFRTYIKDRYMTQSISIFTSIVEGFQAIQNVYITYYDELDDDIIIKIEKDLTVIAQNLEVNNTTKISQIIQFSLTPRLRRLKETFSPSETGKEIIIGIYHDKENPQSLYPEARITALNYESKRQNSKLLFFTSSDVDFQTSEINGLTYIDHNWQRVSVDFPDVINNTGVANKHQQSITERKLRRMVPFTSFHVGNKFYLPKMMVHQRRFADLLVPFKMVQNKQVVYDYLKEEKIAVVKPILGARGDRIYFIQQKGNRFTITDHRHERIYNKGDFDEWIQNTLLRQHFSYMVQRYIDCHTKDKEPYDIRAHMQKNEQGEWVITKVYPRIGSKESILSNISRGGRTESLQNFLQNQFGEKTGKSHNEKLKNLSIDLTAYLDRLHQFSLDELGLDLAIDETGRYWLHEVNNGPQSIHHEDERAVNTIGHAKYIAENGIVKQYQLKMDEGQFNAKKSQLPFAEVDERYCIGMLKAKKSKEDENIALTCAYVSHYENVQFFTFAPEDVDYNTMLIKGFFYENGIWIEKISEYPHVIYDRLRLRGIKQYTIVYEELKGIPTTNEFYGKPISKLEIYNKLNITGKLNDILIPYKQIEKIGDIFQYIKDYQAVIIKPEIGLGGQRVLYICKLENNSFFVAEKDSEIEYSEFRLRKYLNELLRKGTFIVQQYIKSRTVDDHPFDIRIHMVKNAENKWEVVYSLPRIGLYYAIIMVGAIGGYRGYTHRFLKRNYPNFHADNIEENIKTAALKIANEFSVLYDEQNNHVAFDFALDENALPYLIELNAHKPSIEGFEFEIARFAIPNAIYLAKENEKVLSK